MKEELVEARTPTLKPQPQSPKLGGCVGVLFNFFDWNKRLHGSRLFSKRLPAERPNRGLGLKPAGSEEKRTAAKLLLIADESSRASSPSRNGADRDTPLPASPPKRVPGVVARLMGLDSLPSAPTTSASAGGAPPRASFDGGTSSAAAQQPGRRAEVRTQEGLAIGQQPAPISFRHYSGASEQHRAGAFSEARRSPGRANLRAPPSPSLPAASQPASAGVARRPAPGPGTASAFASMPGGAVMGRKASALNEGVRKSPGSKRSPPTINKQLARHSLGVVSDRGSPVGGQLGKVTKTGVVSPMARGRRPILLPSKNHNKVASSSPKIVSSTSSPTKMGSKSAAILLEAAQKILEPNSVKGRTGSAGRPSPIKGPLLYEGDGDGDGNSLVEPASPSAGHGGRRALDFGHAAESAAASDQPAAVATAADALPATGGDSNGFDASRTSSSRRGGPGLPPPGHPRQLHTVVTLRPSAAADRVSYDDGEPASRGRHLHSNSQAAAAPLLSTRFGGGGSPGGSFRLVVRETDFETVLSRYQDCPAQETTSGVQGKKKEAMFGKHDQLGKLTQEQKSELVRSLSVTERPQSLHRSGSVREKVSRASSRMGSLLRSKSAREDKNSKLLLGQAQFLEATEPADIDRVRSPSTTATAATTCHYDAAAAEGGSVDVGPEPLQSSPSEELSHEKKASTTGFRAMKVLRGKSDRKQQQQQCAVDGPWNDVSPPPPTRHPVSSGACATMISPPAANSNSPASADGSDAGSSASKSSGGGRFSYSRLFRARKDKDAAGRGDEKQAGLEEAAESWQQNPMGKTNDSYSIKSLLRRKSSTTSLETATAAPVFAPPPPPVLLRTWGSKKVQADKPSTAQVVSMTPDLDEVFGRSSRGSSFDSNCSKLPVGCLVSELADALDTPNGRPLKDGDRAAASGGQPEAQHNVSQQQHHQATAAGRRKPFQTVSNNSLSSSTTTAASAGVLPTRKSNNLKVKGGHQLEDRDLFDDKAVDEDYERRKAQARLTRAMQRGTVTQFRGDKHWSQRLKLAGNAGCEEEVGEDGPCEDPEEEDMFAAYVAARMEEAKQHDMFWRMAVQECEPELASTDVTERRSLDLDLDLELEDPPLDDYLLMRVKQLNTLRDYSNSSESQPAAAAAGESKSGASSGSLSLTPLEATSKYEVRMSPVVPRVLISGDQGESRGRACEAACIDDSGQPSPVSTLEAPFEDETSSQDGISQDVDESHCMQGAHVDDDELETVSPAAAEAAAAGRVLRLGDPQDVQDELEVARASTGTNDSACEQAADGAEADTPNIMGAILDLSRFRQIDLTQIGLPQAIPISVATLATSNRCVPAAGDGSHFQGLVEDDVDEAYVTSILSKSNFLDTEPPAWHSARLPINPELFTQLETANARPYEQEEQAECRQLESEACSSSSNRGGDAHQNSADVPCQKAVCPPGLDRVQWLDRKLFFDCVNEALHASLSTYVPDVEPWCSKELQLQQHRRAQVVCLRPRPAGKDLVAQVHKQVSQWRSMQVEAVDALLLYDMGHGEGTWTNFVQEVSEVGLEIERYILRAMIEELVMDTLGRGMSSNSSSDRIPSALCVV